jgi:hypothetical protein
MLLVINSAKVLYSEVPTSMEIWSLLLDYPNERSGRKIAEKKWRSGAPAGSG